MQTGGRLHASRHNEKHLHMGTVYPGVCCKRVCAFHSKADRVPSPSSFVKPVQSCCGLRRTSSDVGCLKASGCKAWGDIPGSSATMQQAGSRGLEVQCPQPTRSSTGTVIPTGTVTLPGTVSLPSHLPRGTGVGAAPLALCICICVRAALMLRAWLCLRVCLLESRRVL